MTIQRASGLHVVAGVRPSGHRSAARTPACFQWLARPDGKPETTFPGRASAPPSCGANEPGRRPPLPLAPVCAMLGA